MLSFKSIAGFLKKVSSSSRDDASKDAKQKSGAEGGAGSGAGGYGGSTSTHSSTGAGASVGWSGSASEGATSARGTPANRTAGLGFPGASGGKKSDDANFIESPLFGMPSAFGDNSMFASSTILKGLPQNTSTQDVLRHLQRVVQQRSDELQQQEDAAAAAAAAKAAAEDLNREAAVDAESRSAVTTTTGATARNSLDRVSPRPSHHQVSTAAPSPMDVSPVNTTAARTGTNVTGDTSTTTSPAAVSREDMRHLQRIRGEMIDALDLCLQEVPDNTPQVGAAGGPAGLTEEDRARLEKLAGGGGGRAQPESLTRSNSVVLPSSFTNGMSAMVGAVADGAAAWEESRHIHNASPCGLGGGVGTATPRNTSIVATPVEAAETSTAAVPGPHTPAAGASSVSPTVFTHYEWRCLLLQVVEVIVRIDRIAMHEVRRRAMEKLAPGVIVPLPNAGGTNGGTTEYRWQLLSQVLPAHHKPVSTVPPSSSLTPTRHTQQQQQQQQVNVSAATAAALLNSPHLMMSRSEALLRTPDDAESLTLPIPATLITVASGQATPKDSPLPPSATATSTTATGTALPSPVAKMKHALVESGVLSPDNRVDYAISKEDKKLLEELITVACSLATWAIIKAILRHHQQAILSSRQRRSRRAAAASSAGGDTAATAAMLAANAPAGTSERAVLEMSLSATTAELAGTGNSAASLSGGRPPLVPPPVGAHPSPSPGLEDMGDDAAAAMATAKKNASDEVDDVPYIDWAAVVQELDGWMGGSPGHIVAECTLCASFLRDDGREMVMCMLQKPKPRHLLSNIHRHSEKLRHTDPTVLVAAAPVPPTASPRVPATAQGGSSGVSGTSATGASSSAASPSASSPSGSSSTAPPSPSATTNPAGSGGAASTAATSAGGGTPAASSAANVLPPSPTGSKTNPAVSTTVQAMIDDPTLVMDDLVAQLELVYRQAVGDTWSNFLEGAIESEIHSMQPAKTTGFGAAGVPTAYGDKTGNDEEGVSHSPCTTTTTATTTYSEEPLPKQQSAQSLPSTTSAPSSPLTKDYITDTKTLCRLATAYFFGSDTWSERKRERRFALLYRSMRSRTERYSESAATRRSIRRGTSSAASPTQTATTTAVVSPVVATPMGDSSSPPAAPPPSSLPSQASRGSLGTASVLVPPSTNARASPSLPCTSPPTTVPAMAGGVGSAVLTPMKFSVEDTSSRAPGTTTATAAAASGTSSSPQPQQTATNRHSALNTQLVAHQLCSSNASNAAVSTQSTPMTASLQISRDGGASETDVASGTYHVDGTAPHPTHESGSERYAMGQADQYATWTPFGFMMTSSANTTPRPEQEQSCGQLPQQQQQQQQQSSVSATPLRSDGDSNVASFAGVSHGLPGPFYNGVAPSNTEAVPQQQQQQQPTAQSTAPTSTVPVGHPLSSIVLERIVNMSWSAALHKRGEQCLNAKPPRLEEAEQNAQEERLVAGAFGEFRARQRSLVSLINARLASGKSVEALMNAQKHFRFEKKDWTSHNQTIFSALRYLQSMVLLVRAQAACRVYGAVIETVQLVLPQATLCEQMLQVLAPRPRRDCIIRFADCRSKLLRSYVYLLKECWLAHAAFNDHGKAAKYFSQCVQVLQMLRRRARESELFAAYMERGSQLMKMKNYKKSVEIFKLAVNIAKKSLQDAGTAAASSGSAGSAAPSASVSLGSTMTNMAGIVSAATAGLNVKLGNGGNGSGAPTSAAAVGSASTPSQQFHRNLHFRGAGSGQLYTAEEHSVGTSMATADDMEFTWRVAESERMLALSYVTEAEHEVNVRERREELSNAVSNAYSSQRSLQRWQTKGGTPKRLLTAVPCSLIVICKGLLLLNQARKAALLLEPLIENKPSSALVRPPMWREILDPTEDPYTAEDVVLRTYVCSVKIAVYMLYSRCLAEFDGERALRAVTQVDQLLQESDAWIYAIRTQLRRALEEVRMKDKSVTTLPTTPCTARNLELPRVSAAAVSTLIAKTAVAATAANEDNEDALSTTPQGGGGNETVVSAASTTGTTAALPSAAPAAAAAAAASTKTTEVPPLRISNMNIPHSTTTTNNSNNNNASASSYSTTTAAASSTTAIAAAATEGDAARTSPYTGGHRGPDYNSPEEAPLRQRRFNVTGMAGSVNSIAPSRDDLLRDEDEPSRQSTLMQTSAGSVNVDPWNCGNAHLTGAYPTPPASTRSPRTQQSPRAPTLRIHMESTSECMTALFALREGKSHIRKALRDIFIVSGDAHSLIKNWEEALKSYSHALVISMGEVEAANAAAQSRRQVNSHYATPRNAQPSPRTSNVGGTHEDCNSATTSHIATGAASASHHATAGSGGSGRNNGGGGATSTATTNTNNNNNNNNYHGGSASDTRGGGATTTRAARGSSSSSAQCWGQVVPLDEEFFLWDEEDVLIADNMLNRDLTSSTAAKDLRAVVADEERMDSRACESLVLSKLANVYRALDKPTTAIHYHNLVLDYANECNDKLLAYNSMLSLARLYTAACSQEEARESWAKVSDLAKDYEDKEVSRETKRNIVVGQEAAGMYLDVVKTAEELEKLATGEEGEDAAADRRFALEALANANLQLGQYDACIAALDNREKVQEKSAEWNGRLLSMRAKARMGLNKPTDAIKVMQSWAVKARNLGNWVELGKANSALSAAYASENQNMQARHYHEATLNAFALAETLSEDCQHIALDSARWLVHYAYLDDATVQVDPALTFTGGCLTSDSEASGGDFRYTDSGLCNSSGDLGEMLAKEEELRRSSSSLIADGLRGRISDRNTSIDDDDEDNFFGSGGSLSNHSLFGMHLPALSDADAPDVPPPSVNVEEGEAGQDASAAASTSATSSSETTSSGSTGEAGEGAENEEVDGVPLLQRHSSSAFHPKDPSCDTAPPSLAASVNRSMHEDPTQQDTLELNYSGSSAGQSEEVGDSDAVAEEIEDEARRRREVDEALRTMDEDADTADHPSEVAAAVAAAAQNNMFFRMGNDFNAAGDDGDGDDAADANDPTSLADNASGKAPSKTASAPPTPNITTAAAKPSTSAAAAGGTKSASSNYVPPPTALANVSICSRPAAAAAGTDVLEMPVDANRSASEPTSGSGPSGTGSSLSAGTAHGSGGFGNGRNTAAAAAAAAAARLGGEEGHLERKPATVRTTYYRGALEMMETAAQLLLVPRSVSRMVVPYSPAEAVDLALLSHPHSLFVFYFAEYTTEYGAQCDVVVRPPGTAGFLKLRTQISLKEYHSKDVVNALLTTISADISVAGDRTTAGATTMNTIDPGASLSHPFVNAMAKAGAAGGSSSAGASPTLANVRPDALRAALDDETRSCLRNLHADAWQPIIDRMHREKVSYQDADTVIIMPDIALLHLPFAGLLPSPDYGGEDAPLGEQFTLVVTPSLSHFVYHGMSKPHPHERTGGVLDPRACRYIFVPYAAAGVGAPPFTAGSGCSSLPSSPRPRQPATSQSAKSTTTTTATGGGGGGKLAPSGASPSPWPSVSAAQSIGDSTLTPQTSATAAGSTATGAARRESALGAASDGAASSAADACSFEDLLKTWKVHRGCTRKELIHAFTDCRTRALMFLGPMDQGGVRVADGVVTMQDITQSLQQARSLQASQGSNAAGGAAPLHPAPSSSLSIPLPPLCTHMDLLVLTADRGLYPTVTNGGMAANLCMSLGVHRVLRLNIVHGLAPSEEHYEFIANFCANLQKVARWSLTNPYAVALRTTIAEARVKGMSSNTWGAFTLMGSA